jgi:preprotein translocase subunit SecE
MSVDMAMNPAKFIREVRMEVGKVTWPTRKETMVSTAMVLILALIAALFFLAVDGIFAVVISWILGLGK